jgi:hypothetical protein|eukprot:COSAG01_NODE_1769_length_9272_cov_34.805298_10_plen_123_part_00
MSVLLGAGGAATSTPCVRGERGDCSGAEVLCQVGHVPALYCRRCPVGTRAPWRRCRSHLLTIGACAWVVVHRRRLSDYLLPEETLAETVEKCAELLQLPLSEPAAADAGGGGDGDGDNNAGG